METYHEEELIIKDPETAKELEKREATKKALSRRKFVRNAAIGAAAAGAALTLKGGAGGSDDALAQSGTEDGTGTIDATLITYVSSPAGSVGNSSLTLTDTFSSTFRLSAAANASLSIGTSSTFTFGSFTSTTGRTFNQSVSAQVTDAITINSTFSIQIPTPAPGQPNHTVFYGLFK